MVSAELREMLRIAAHWNAGWLRVFSGSVDLPAGYPVMADVVSTVLPMAPELGVGIALETHDDLSSARAATLLEWVPDPAFAALWDFIHTWKTGGSPTDAWDALGARSVDLQVKDANPPERPQQRHRVVGDGQVTP